MGRSTIRATTIDNLFSKIDKKIALSESYTEINNLAKITKFCRLKPFSIQKSNKLYLQLERKWIDEFGNSLNIINKSIKINIGDLEVDRSKLTTTDMYYGLSINKIHKISKLLFIFAGKDEDFNKDHIILSYLGIDDFLRTFYVYDSELKQCSPLEIGFNNLMFIADNINISDFVELPSDSNIIMLPCSEQRSWLSSLPLGNNFLDEISQYTDTFLKLFQGEI